MSQVTAKQTRRLAAAFMVLAVTLVSSSRQAAAEPAYLNGNLLTVPVVVVGEQFYSADFELNTTAAPAQLTLVDAYELTRANTIGASSFHDNILFIPDIRVDGENYWVKFELLGNAAFTLLEYDFNDLGVDRNPIGLIRQPDWQRTVGKANDVGVGAGGSVWVVGNDERKGGFGIYRWTDSAWTRVDGAAVRIDVDHEGNPWIVNDEHHIFRYRNGKWIRLPGDARDIGIGANGAVWVVSTGGVFRWNGIEWVRYIGSGIRIDVDPAGNPWVAGSDGDIYLLQEDYWREIPGEARDIGVGADGSVWITGTRDDEGVQRIYRWDGSNWNQVRGSGRQISVDPDGKPWIVSSESKIYQAQ